MRISAPPVKWPCFYGIDFATRAELIANGMLVDQIRESIGADSLEFVSLEGLVEATTIPRERLCTACFTADYPIQLPADHLIGKHLLESISRTVITEPDPVLPGIGAADALSRP
jgi:amidophosphoribosyltransferase